MSPLFVDSEVSLRSERGSMSFCLTVDSVWVTKRLVCDYFVCSCCLPEVSIAC